MKNRYIVVIPVIASLLNGEVEKTAIVTSHVYVIDKISGAPIEGASVKAWFEVDIGWQALIESAPIITAETITDKSGRCDLSGKTNTGDVTIEARKKGLYYEEVSGFKYSRKNQNNSWQPDNLVVTIALQRVEHPIPLFVKRIEHQLFSTNDFFEQTGNNLSFDLLKGDWLPPKGTGSVADVIFNRKYFKGKDPIEVSYKVMVYPYRYEMPVHFPGQGNGLLPFIPKNTWGIRLRTAPEEGYSSDITCFSEYNGRKTSNRDKNRCYYFRIRTKRNEKGEIVSAYYGKIYGDIGLSKEYQMPEFLYYLNTTPLDRNLEWDMKNNLCPVETRTYPLEP